MATTNFALLTTEQKTVWAMDTWHAARNYSFINQFLGTGPNSMVQHITELTKSEKGARAVITLLADLEGDGVAGDRTLESNEEQAKTSDQVIQIDQLRHATKLEGRMADQKSIVEFRNNSRDILAYWLADRIDQLAFLTLSGVAYSMGTSGVARTGSDLINLDFASDVVAPSTLRRLRWDGTTNNTLVSSAATSGVVATDTPTWEMMVQLKAYAKNHYVRGIKQSGNEEIYHAFMTPSAMAKLKLDDTYMANVRNAMSRSSSNPLFTGGGVQVDGIVLHEFRHVYNTQNATSGSGKWGAGSDVDGCQVLFCGAQALAMADIGAPTWVEKLFDFDNQPGISVGKIFGFLKPQFNSIYDSNTTQDFGVISCYVAQ